MPAHQHEVEEKKKESLKTVRNAWLNKCVSYTRAGVKTLERACFRSGCFQGMFVCMYVYAL